MANVLLFLWTTCLVSFAQYFVLFDPDGKKALIIIVVIII